MAPPLRGTTHTVSFRALDDGRWVARRARVAVEERWALEAGGRVAATLACTPADLEALAAGHLLNEGLARPGDISRVEMDRRRHILRVHLRGPLRADPLPRVASKRAEPAGIFARMEEMLQGAQLYRAARGVHTSALTDDRGLRWLAEDVGKYNALDKLRGLAHLQGRPTRGLLLLTTGRLTGGMVAKGLRMGVPVMATIGGTTAEGVVLARRGGAALAGYVRGRSLNLYAGRPAA